MIENSFDKGPEGWCSYDYHWSIVAGGPNIFVLATWQESGGIDDSGHIWADQSRWSTDTPETPTSILPLLVYRNWSGLDPIDLREAEVSVYLRGDGLQLDGAKCYFWVHSVHCRWHFDGSPLTIAAGAWSPEPNRFTLANDESMWRMSWSRDPANPLPLDEVLASAESYGFSFVGFGQEPRGRFSIDEFEIKTAGA